jgi:bacterioferritin (cytochrome b1)
MATRDFEVRQLLKAYRKGLISDELFEEQMRELSNGQRSYTYNGQNHASEREMIMHLLDEFRCAENFAAEYLNRWIEVSDLECVKGGLRVIQQREAYHAQILEARLRELGGIPQCTVPAERREKEVPFYASTELKDTDKLESIAARLKDPAAVLKPITDVIAQIEEDQQSKELLRSLVDDEMSSIKWLLEACQTLSAAKATQPAA